MTKKNSQRIMVFQSTLPVRGATELIPELNLTIDISIHAPREGSDFYFFVHDFAQVISIHAPREGSDP